MKLQLILIATLLYLPTKGQNITGEERTHLVEYLSDTQHQLTTMIDGLSENQVNYKQNPESWSIAEVIEHLALSESFIFGLAEGSLKEHSDTLSGDLTDEQVVKIISSRESKVKTTPNLEPSMSFGSYEGALKEFKSKRKQHIKYAKSTKEDLRNHFFQFPFGTADCYQVILFLAGHTERHSKQIGEIMSSQDFPGT